MDIIPQLLLNSLIAGSIYALASSGLAVSYGLLRVLNFAQGHFMMIGAYFFYWQLVMREGGMAQAALFSAGLMLTLGAISYLLFVKPFLSYSTLLPFVTTLALGAILESSVSMAFGVNVRSFSLPGTLESYHIEFPRILGGVDQGAEELRAISGVFITPVQIFIIAASIMIMLTLAIMVHLTPIGRSLRALCENRYAAESLGRDYNSVSLGTFCLATLLAGFAGVLVGLETNIQPTMGHSFTIKAFAAMILGGLGSIWGTVAGSYIIGLIENLSIGLDFWGYSLPAGYKDAFAFVFILLVLLLRPQGLFRRKGRAV